MMELNDYSKFVEKYTVDDFSAPFHTIDIQTLRGYIGLTSEVGEIGDLVKRAMFRGAGLNRDDLIDECGDIIHYVQVMLASVGSNLQQSIDYNTTKLTYRTVNGKDKIAERVEQLKLVVNE